MPERGFDTSFWTEPPIRPLPPHAKLLLVYLGTNDHCDQAGVYTTDLPTLAFETNIPEAELPSLLKTLSSKIGWFPDQNIIWVKNFVFKQTKSSKFLIAAAKCLKKLNNNGIAVAVVKYNSKVYGISIPYQYPINGVSIPPVSATVSVSSPVSKSVTVEEIGGSRGEEELAAVSKLYEENIGQLTPIIAERLKFDAETYPAGWFHEALKEALGAGVRKLKYIEAILERWQREGIKSPKKQSTVVTGPVEDKYTKGRYGHMVDRTGGDTESIKKIREAEQ